MRSIQVCYVPASNLHTEDGNFTQDRRMSPIEFAHAMLCNEDLQATLRNENTTLLSLISSRAPARWSTVQKWRHERRSNLYLCGKYLGARPRKVNRPVSA